MVSAKVEGIRNVNYVLTNTDKDLRKAFTDELRGVMKAHLPALKAEIPRHHKPHTLSSGTSPTGLPYLVRPGGLRLSAKVQIVASKGILRYVVGDTKRTAARPGWWALINLRGVKGRFGPNDWRARFAVKFDNVINAQAKKVVDRYARVATRKMNRL